VKPTKKQLVDLIIDLSKHVSLNEASDSLELRVREVMTLYKR